MGGFYIVCFVNEADAPEIIASNWITGDGDKCFYPIVKTNKMRDRLLCGKVEPDATWGTHRIRIIGTYETYDAARKDLPHAEKTLNLERIEDLEKRKAKKRHLTLPGEESEEEVQPSKQRTKHKPLMLKVKPHCPSTQPCSSEPNNSYLLIPQFTSPTITTEHNSNLEFIKEKLESITQWMGDVSIWMGNISNKIDVMDTKIERILASKETSNEDDQKIEFSELLPVRTIEDFLNLEHTVINDQLLRKKLVKFLSRCGGKDLQKTASAIMARLMVDEVAQCYNLTGKSTKGLNKNSFVSTRLWQIVLLSCQKVIKDSTTDKVKECVANWLHQAKTRIIRRARPAEILGLQDTVFD